MIYDIPTNSLQTAVDVRNGDRTRIASRYKTQIRRTIEDVCWNKLIDIKTRDVDRVLLM